MKLIEILKTSLTTMRMNIRRTLLTMIGIVIGIAAVIVILAIGNGTQRKAMKDMLNDEQGRPNQEFYFETNNPDVFDDLDFTPYSKEDLQGIKSIPGVDDAVTETPKYMSQEYYAELKHKSNSTYESFAVSEETNETMVVGRNLTIDDSINKSPYIILSSLKAEELFGGPDQALQKPLTVEGRSLTVVGVYTPGGFVIEDEDSLLDEVMDSMNDISSSGGIVPKGYYERIHPPRPSNIIRVFYKPGYDAKLLSKRVEEYLKENGSQKDNGTYLYYDTTKIQENILESLGLVTMTFAYVAGISLFIAGVGVMNMMYTSVSERIQEIGIRRALGASKFNITLQFLTEGVAITTIGGLLGLGLGFLITNTIPKSFMEPYIDIKSSLICMGIAMGIGIVFSVLPARSAGRRNLIDILR